MSLLLRAVDPEATCPGGQGARARRGSFTHAAFLPILTDLQAFEVAARHSSFTRAAQELCVTQGAVSKQVKHLEAFVGVELFLRIRQGLVLTEAGRAYLAKIQAGLGQIEAATVELIAHQGRGGTLNLTCMPTFGARWLIPRLTAFMRQRPDIHVEFLPHRQGYDFSTPSWTPPCASAKACGPAAAPTTSWAGTSCPCTAPG